MRAIFSSSTSSATSTLGECTDSDRDLWNLMGCRADIYIYAASLHYLTCVRRRATLSTCRRGSARLGSRKRQHVSWQDTTRTLASPFPLVLILLQVSGSLFVRCLCVTIADAATKGAITAFSKSLAIDEASSGVRVNVISPGNIWTPLWKSWSDGGATRLLHLRFLLLTILCPSTLEPPSRLTPPRALLPCSSLALTIVSINTPLTTTSYTHVCRKGPRSGAEVGRHSAAT